MITDPPPHRLFNGKIDILGGKLLSFAFRVDLKVVNKAFQRQSVKALMKNLKFLAFGHHEIIPGKIVFFVFAKSLPSRVF